MSQKKMNLFPVVKAQDEEDLVDPQQVIRDQCREHPKAQALLEKLTTCNDRVNSRKATAENCIEEVSDLFHYVDHCVAKSLFSKLK